MGEGTQDRQHPGEKEQGALAAIPETASLLAFVYFTFVLRTWGAPAMGAGSTESQTLSCVTFPGSVAKAHSGHYARILIDFNKHLLRAPYPRVFILTWRNTGTSLKSREPGKGHHLQEVASKALKQGRPHPQMLLQLPQAAMCQV
jgi:hypothetical protein